MTRPNGPARSSARNRKTRRERIDAGCLSEQTRLEAARCRLEGGGLALGRDTCAFVGEEMLLLDQCAAAARRADRARLDRVLELADVARPLGGFDGAQRSPRELTSLEPVLFARARTEVSGELRNVGRALGERRNAKPQDREPVEEILPLGQV